MGSKEIWDLDFRQSFAFVGKVGEFAANEKRSLQVFEEVYVTQMYILDLGRSRKKRRGHFTAINEYDKQEAEERKKAQLLEAQEKTDDNWYPIVE